MEQKMELNVEIGKRVRQARKDAGVNQTRFAMVLGLSRGSLSNIESGRQALQYEHLYKIAEVLGVNVYDLLPPLNSDSSVDIFKPIEQLPRPTKEKPIKCPVCRSKDVALIELREGNGVLGPGFSSWVTDSYYSCHSCGVRFDKIPKP
ncbi:helix-turn-helix domain-containing protein [Larkinella terrae]|uniref:Helix-turn-helix domain-containing protein n=1 Tax=Larkinella terrae TaxID=2025311 RepID=A0A7K0EJX2_9BACT|nr:helix-turn-helix transcriptional regulator [Larkinella terrae]MRS61821.1 helix-turn-helix domain-containing protein [Larkinella terrae]